MDCKVACFVCLIIPSVCLYYYARCVTFMFIHEYDDPKLKNTHLYAGAALTGVGGFSSLSAQAGKAKY